MQSFIQDQIWRSYIKFQQTMEKKQILHQKKHTRRNSSLFKTLQKNCSYKFEELPPIELQQQKVTKMIGPKIQSSPNSNQRTFRIVQKRKYYSQQSKVSINIPFHKKQTVQKVKSNSFISSIAMETKSLRRQKKEKGVGKDKNFQADDQIINEHLKSLKRTQQIMEERNSQMKRKRSKTNNIQCKILLLKNNGFPFMLRNLNTVKNSAILKEKQNIVSLELDISRINQDQDLPEKQFISKDSFRQIIIF